jgi:hypothetical protein
LLKVLAETRKLFINSPTEFFKSIHLSVSTVRYELLQTKNSAFSRYKGTNDIVFIGEVDLLASDYAAIEE